MLRIFRGERRPDHADPPADAEQSADGPGQASAAPASTGAGRPDGASPIAASNGHGEGSPTAAQAAQPGAAQQPGAVSGEAPQQGAVPGEAPQQGAVPGEAPQQGAVPGEAPASQLPAEPGFLQRGKIRRRARFLRAARELAYRDLGGLVFDLHRFGQRNDEVVAAKLETLRRIDEELRALEDALKERSPITVLREVGVAACPRCAAIHGSGDRFCPACGMPVAPSERPIGGAPAHPSASPAMPQHSLAPQQPVHAYQPPLPAHAPAISPAPLPLPNAAPPAAAQQIGNGAYPALPAAPAAPATAAHPAPPAPATPTAPALPISPSQLGAPQPSQGVPESPTEVLPSQDQSTRAFEPVPPAPSDPGRRGGEGREAR